MAFFFLVLFQARIFLNCHLFSFFQQCWWRAVLKRLWFIRLCSATVVLQKAYRRKLDARNKSAAKIQALVRGHLTRNQLRLFDKSALRIQVGKGSWFSSCYDLPSHLEQAQLQKLIEVAVGQINIFFSFLPCYQTFWRGYRVRRTVSSLKVKRVRRRIESANAAATEPMKLCNRTRSALDFLLKCKNISRIVGALTNLGKFDVEIPRQHISLKSLISQSIRTCNRRVVVSAPTWNTPLFFPVSLSQSRKLLLSLRYYHAYGMIDGRSNSKERKGTVIERKLIRRCCD